MLSQLTHITREHKVILIDGSIELSIVIFLLQIYCNLYLDELQVISFQICGANVVGSIWMKLHE